MELITLINALIDAIKTIITIEIIKKRRRYRKESVICVVKKDVM